MVEEIPLSEIGTYAQHFSNPQLDMVLASIAEGNTKAQLWRLVHSQSGTTCILWDKGNNVFYLSGNTIVKETTEDLVLLISTQIKKRAIEEGLLHFRAGALLPLCEASVSQLFQNIQLRKINEGFYVFPKQRVPALQAPVLENVTYERIDMRFLEENQYQNIQHVKSEVEWMWTSQERFRENGFGYAAVLAGTIICWCTAEYVSKKKCGIGIETIQKYQNKGIATATTAHFVKDCLSHNIIPHWECDSRNLGSIRVAEKVGFEKIHETTFWSGRFSS